MSPHSSPFPSCFRPTAVSTSNNHHPPPPPPPPPTTSGNPNLTNCLYQTELGLFSLTWSTTLFGHSLDLHLHPLDTTAATATCSPFSLSNLPSLSTLSFHLHIKPFIFWKKHGSKKLHINGQDGQTSPRIQIFWDLSKAKFGSGSGPEPQSGFYIAVVVEREIVLVVGDLIKQAFLKTRTRKQEIRNQILVLRREHIYGNRVYTTKAVIGGKNRDISIDCSVNSDARLCIAVDNIRVLQIKRLKWKFRGNEKIEVDGVVVQFSWDVYNWFFEDVSNGHAVFMFRFEETSEAYGGGEDDKNGVVSWQQNSCTNGFGMSGIEWRKMRRSFIGTTRSSSSSSISMSSASSGGGSSSIMEWASTEENELSSSNGVALVVYAWRK
ncbi:uncharacterized protein LOC126669303 [Mercurialis annua]|uniref:uncharacterized protein LOC126669303 n=1 Tax=Mercurialis annua TaxID=3986 RepID=UPI002160EC2B|nr:uncharacterized protein LOC126669303 [Mercurialis annua]XP_050218702.1 uncharacterized protein LOC126669303 [Mercurialis annua]